MASGICLLGAEAPDVATQDPQQVEAAMTGSSLSPTPSGAFIREGTELVNQVGYFRVTGERLTFFTEDGRGRFLVLENLNLERIAKAIADEPAQSEWIVTATVTEFRGANFLFIRRAVVRNNGGRSEDAALSRAGGGRR